MSVQSASGLTRVAPVIFSLLLGGVGGFYLSNLNHTTASPSGRPASGGAMGGSGGEMARAMPGGGGGGGGMGGGQAASANALPRLVRNLATMEKVQNKGLTDDQKKKLQPLLEQIQSAEKLPEKESSAKLAAIEALLNADQKEALQNFQVGRGGGGGGGMGGMMGGGVPGSASGARGPTSGGGMGGGMMGGGMGGSQPDPERPFASERNKQALSDLIASVKSSGKP